MQFRRFLAGCCALSYFALLCSSGSKYVESSYAEEKSEEPASAIGRKVEDFSLKDFRGKTHALADFENSPVVVLAFLGTECPLAKLYSPRLERLAGEYESQGVAFLGIDSNQHDSITEIAAHARVHGLSFPMLKDLGNRVADACGASRTPEVFVLDEDRRVVYHGRIDDQYGIGYVRDEPRRHDLKLALDQHLAGEKIVIAETESPGCLIGRVRKPDPHSKVTYAGDIAGILRKHCIECHRAGEIAPFALTEYEEVAGWAEMIAEVVDEGRMPPWHASSKHGTFSNARGLTEEEKRTIHAWVAAGAPEGDPADLPAPPSFVAGWQLPRAPDVVFPMRAKPYHVPAEGAVRYQYFIVDPKFTEDKWIEAAEVQPGNRAVVHHVLVAVRTPNGQRHRGPGEFLTAYVPGLRFGAYPPGMAKRIPAGSKLVFQVHYTPNGSPQDDISRVGFLFADESDIEYRIVTKLAVQPRLDIPPGEADYETEATSRPIAKDALLLGLSPHMHLRGKSFRFAAIHPDGRRETLLDVPAYDFNWQTSYRLAKPLELSAGTRIHCEAHFDNSEDNLANPDPTQRVRWGDQTWEEMMIGYFDIATPVAAEPEKSQTKQTAKSDEKSADEKIADENGDEAQAEQLLTRFDSDGDGRIVRAEIPERAIPLFEALDADENDAVTQEELVRAIRNRRERREKQ